MVAGHAGAAGGNGGAPHLRVVRREAFTRSVIFVVRLATFSTRAGWLC